jgi:hypothetical protein
VFTRIAANRLTAYDAHGLCPKETVKLLQGLKLNILVHFQHADLIVSNKQEAEFFYYLAQHNPETTFLVMGNDGGHLHTHAALAKAIPEFKNCVAGNHMDICIADTHAPIANGVLTQFPEPAFELMQKKFADYHVHEFDKSIFGKMKKLVCSWK